MQIYTFLKIKYLAIIEKKIFAGVKDTFRDFLRSKIKKLLKFYPFDEKLIKKKKISIIMK